LDDREQMWTEPSVNYLRYYPSVEMEGLNETMKKISQESRYTG